MINFYEDEIEEFNDWFCWYVKGSSRGYFYDSNYDYYFRYDEDMLKYLVKATNYHTDKEVRELDNNDINIVIINYCKYLVKNYKGKISNEDYILLNQYIGE